MQGQSLRGTNSATTRTKAVTIAKDMVERIRSNNANASDYDDASVDSADSAPTAPENCPGANCILTDYDLYRLELAVRELPQGSASISLDSTVGVNGEVTVTITWKNPNDQDEQTFDLRAAL
jgi:type IV pilus modification protein PilV